ncbi:hypothetical protein M3686_11205 [Micrococcus luteus]|uniref:hypothetical protein n=1 Tax=Micrococcus luteus TaxID=1270 RepID=UPI00203CD0EF|nr:hypothetical protein [Micrococcus luteus]MCM3578687.1 hypothetical protein [Micrococcus luteus]
MTTPDTTTRNTREALDDLHLIAHHAGPTDDPSAGHRRGADLWDATRAPGNGDTVRPWADLDAVVQAHTAAVITRALADGLEVEQVMYRALSAALDLVERFETERGTSHTEDEAIAWDNAATLLLAALKGETRA